MKEDSAINFDNQDLLEQLPGYYLWKDLDSRYITGNLNAAKLFGFKGIEHLQGITDYNINCDVVKYADQFVAQDKELRANEKSLTILTVHPYINGEMKAIINQKNYLH